MDKLTIFKNKGEVFRCQFKIDGAEIADTKVRLCLEFDDNRNLFFHCTLSESGECVVEIPKLKDIKKTEAKMSIEAIADGVYFKLFEADAELKNSVEVTMDKPKVKRTPKTHVELEGFSQEGAKNTPDPEPESVNESEPEPVKKPVVEETEEEAKQPGWEKFGYHPRPKKQVMPKAVNGDRFKSFDEYMKNGKSH